MAQDSLLLDFPPAHAPEARQQVLFDANQPLLPSSTPDAAAFTRTGAVTLLFERGRLGVDELLREPLKAAGHDKTTVGYALRSSEKIADLILDHPVYGQLGWAAVKQWAPKGHKFITYTGDKSTTSGHTLKGISITRPEALRLLVGDMKRSTADSRVRGDATTRAVADLILLKLAPRDVDAIHQNLQRLFI